MHHAHYWIHNHVFMLDIVYRIRHILKYLSVVRAAPLQTIPIKAGHPLRRASSLRNTTCLVTLMCRPLKAACV